MMAPRIPEIEINTSNVCSGRCFICAGAHGRDCKPFMEPEVLVRLVENLRKVEFDVIQTGGNGDCWLNPQFMSYLRILRREFPNRVIANYSNFVLYSPEIADEVLADRLIDRQFTRIDTLHFDRFRRSTNLNPEIVFANLGHFARHNKSVELHIGYSSIAAYYRLCRRILKGKPFHGPFSEVEALDFPDEFEAIQRRWPPDGHFVRHYRINQSLWAERENPRTRPDLLGRCPKLKAGILERVTWVSPDGSVNACGYDDGQGQFICGNIMEEDLGRIWFGNRRHKILEAICRRDYQGSPWPCNPRCCRMYPQET